MGGSISLCLIFGGRLWRPVPDPRKGLVDSQSVSTLLLGPGDLVLSHLFHPRNALFDEILQQRDLILERFIIKRTRRNKNPTRLDLRTNRQRTPAVTAKRALRWSARLGICDDVGLDTLGAGGVGDTLVKVSGCYIEGRGKACFLWKAPVVHECAAAALLACGTMAEISQLGFGRNGELDGSAEAGGCDWEGGVR